MSSKLFSGFVLWHLVEMYFLLKSRNSWRGSELCDALSFHNFLDFDCIVNKPDNPHLLFDGQFFLPVSLEAELRSVALQYEKEAPDHSGHSKGSIS